ncbi:putative glycosyltransferase family 15 [Leptomonas pyrrhocoris]|uniref:Putative glycosyltransferase family 15 n=1 Tax=Leptomonas pyrrhocoris TaxID=157538 RepID=A0A0N0VG08_LEPPY|nr:putative glycosyltransferase family 15 [Leptomonas pyrrhocoris]XP_015660701.1 putative glycosyltransferase family 15 [Leptomonas pyrrhocoris]KPA82261.1 putative glycosyltransferase family 15 [Leptomonas pyrrhocoris]KPA82262.1 putative glycosyltransferase family 15 [Leptomonas pyrrhocoris]|eukprot:XP_015660700.1 putative glycosyltransferase family 15 [Leptomonas pyrrhocoris]
MQPPSKKVLCNVVLLVILIILSAATVEYRILHEAILSGRVASVVESRNRFNPFSEDLYSFVARQQLFLAGDGKHSCVTLSFYPQSDKVGGPAAVQLHNNKNASSSPLPSSPPRTTPLEAIRLRSSIILKEASVLRASPNTIPWRVQTERLASSLMTSPRTTTLVTTTVPDAAPIPTAVHVEGPLVPSSLSSNFPSTVRQTQQPTMQTEAATPAAMKHDAPKSVNAVILLMSPTFSSETVPTSVQVDTTSPQGFTNDFAQPVPPPGTGAPTETTTTSATPWRCRRCQQFLEKLLPTLETEYLSRYPYPVHILHRGIMPSEVVQYIITVLASASRITIEDISGVLAEKVTLTSSMVLEPWLKEIGADLYYRRRFSTFPPMSTAPPETPPPTEETTTGAGLVGGGGEMLTPVVVPGTGVGAGGGAGGGNNGGGFTEATNTPAGGNHNNDVGPYDDADGTLQALRERWELRRFWAGPLSMLSSLQSYDYFWYLGSQSHLTKPLARDVLADVVNHTCAVAYHQLSYLTHKRVSDLWRTMLDWNEHSAGLYFSQDELERALSWLSDDLGVYGGKIYSSDCYIMSFAVTRHPAYVDFFHWIDSRPPYGLMKKQWSPLAIYTVFAQLLMEKHGWDACWLDPLSGYRTS